MKRMRFFVSFGVLFLFFACADTLPTTEVEKPYAVGGADQTASIGVSVVLDGTGSYDLKNRQLEYSWVFSNIPPAPGSALTNSSITILNAEASIVQFSPDVSGNYDLVLTVGNGKGSDVDHVVVTVGAAAMVTNVRPTAVAGPDQTVTVGTPVTLDGSNSTDPEGSSLTYIWTFSVVPPVSGSSLTNSSLTSISANNSVITFTPDVVGSYVLNLEVKDPENAAHSDFMIVQAN